MNIGRCIEAVLEAASVPNGRGRDKMVHKLETDSTRFTRLYRFAVWLLLSLTPVVVMYPAHAGIGSSIERSALKRLESTAAARVAGKAIYRKLPARIEASFERRVYAQRVLKKDLIAYRYHSPLNPHHEGYVFLTTDKYVSEKLLRERLAIPKGARTEGQHITAVATYRVPHGTLISEGSVAANYGFKGGGYQIVVENPPDAWIVKNQSFKRWRTGQ